MISWTPATDEQLQKQIHDFVDLVVDDLGRAPRWWKRMLADMAREILFFRRRKHRLVDAPAPYAELLKIRRAA